MHRELKVRTNPAARTTPKSGVNDSTVVFVGYVQHRQVPRSLAVLVYET